MKKELITFRAKIENLDGARWRVKFPRFTSSHVDMSVMRGSKIYGSFANSDMLPGMLDRAARKALKCSRDASYIYSDSMPESVDVDRTGFLAKVTIDISEGWK